MSFAAIATTYRGRHYRSRLEARWAAFFDELGWQFEYEPFDLKGWVPDFVLIGANQSILVEVKPITHFDKAVAQKITLALPTGQEALLVGCCLPTSTYRSTHHPCVGWLAEWYALPTWEYDGGGSAPLSERRDSGDDNARWGWDLAPFAWYSARPDFADFTSESGFYRGRLTGEYDGGRWGNAASRINEITDCWGAAAWQVQWRAR